MKKETFRIKQNEGTLNWICRIWRRNCLQKQVIAGKAEGKRKKKKKT
jgi:hypothetical protein